MKAIVNTKYGLPDLLELKDVGKLVPKGKEILIKNHATTTYYGDAAARNFKNIPQNMGAYGRYLCVPGKEDVVITVRHNYKT